MSYTYKVKLERSDGKAFVITYDGLKDDLGILQNERWCRALFDRVDRLEDGLREIYTKEIKVEIIEYVKTHPDIQTRILNKALWPNLTSILQNSAYYEAFKQLEDSGAIIPTSHGSGKNRTWRVS